MTEGGIICMHGGGWRHEQESLPEQSGGCNMTEGGIICMHGGGWRHEQESSPG
jgi:hypothetical protein